MPSASRLAEAFHVALELGPETDVETLAYGEHPHWDDIGHMALVAEIEDAYGVMFETDVAEAMTSYAKIVELLERLEVVA